MVNRLPLAIVILALSSGSISLCLVVAKGMARKE